MDLPDSLLAVFSNSIEYRDGEAVVTIPEQELTLGEISAGETYRIAVLEQIDANTGDEAVAVGTSDGTTRPEPPVEEGDEIEVEIEDIGEQGDGIARVGPGYIVFVPETDVGDRVTVEITDARENFAFASLTEPEPVSDSGPSEI